MWSQISKKIFKLFFGTILIIASLAGAISLISYNAYDPSLNNAFTTSNIHNYLGLEGAFFADFSLQTFGFAIISIILVLVGNGFRLLFNLSITQLKIKLLLLPLLLLCSAVACAFIDVGEKIDIISGGGWLGWVIKIIADSYMNEQYLLFLSVICSSFLFLYMIEINPIKLIKNTSIIVYLSFKKLLMLLIINKIRKIFKLSSKNTEISDEYEEDSMLFVDEETENTPIIKKAKKAMKFSNKKISNNPSKKQYQLPSYSLLKENKKSANNISKSYLDKQLVQLQQVLKDFGIKGEIIDSRTGPVVTLFELEPAAGTKSSRIIGLADDIARSMSALSARIAVVPGKNLIGIELPNQDRQIVFLHEIFVSKDFADTKCNLPLALGKNIGGESVIADLAKMPHLLVAGTTGSGKSVAINTMILSLLYKLTPEECKFIMIDPKMLELSVYDGIPHLLSPVVTEPKKAVTALKWVVREMENRYRMMSNIGVRNIGGYNEKIEQSIANNSTITRSTQTGFDPETGKPIYEKVEIELKKLPFIVVIVDEMADLMLVAGKDIEASIQRLAQMARAAGIHIIMATQRPSVDVITGVIKANFPTRISFQVTSKIDSRTILGEMGAEQLLGMGDMLYMAGGSKIYRVHGPFVSDQEVENIVKQLKSQGEPEYINDVTTDHNSEDEASAEPEVSEGGDELYNQAVQIIIRDKKVSTSYIQRCLKIGYNRAANIIEQMEKNGIISEANHVGKRTILMGNDND
jgi:S-DNA-T family DNA segregation ATPase FtsK/SpoIIIE